MKKPTVVRFKVPWRHYVVGQEITPPGMLRGWLIANGFVEIVRPENDLQTAMAAPPTENAAVRTTPPTRKRGRPRNVR